MKKALDSRGRDPDDSTASGIVMICDVDLNEMDATRIHTIEVASGFAREGFGVDLITRGEDPLLPGVRHHRTKGSEHRRLGRIAAITIRSCAVLVARRRHARRCYVRERWSNVPILILARMLGYCLVVQVDDIEFGEGYDVANAPVVDYAKRRAAHLMGFLAHAIVAVTPEIKTLLVNQSGVPSERVTVLPNGANVDFFTPQPRQDAIAGCGLDPALRYVLFCGRFQPWVDFALMLSAFSLVVREHPDARLMLVGDGVERPAIESRIEQLDLEPYVTITGFVEDRERVRDLIGASTVTLSANRADYRARMGVSPLKVAEYMACGRAVVATDIAGMREAVQQTGAGLVVPANAERVADAIVESLDPVRADGMGAAGRRIAEERYAWSSIARRTLTLFT